MAEFGGRIQTKRVKIISLGNDIFHVTCLLWYFACEVSLYRLCITSIIVLVKSRLVTNALMYLLIKIVRCWFHASMKFTYFCG